MSFRSRLFLLFLLTVLASVTVVAWGVARYTRNAFEEMDTQRTEALVAQFRREFAQRGEEVVHRVENITNAEVTLRTAIALAQPNADLSVYVHDANGAAQEQNLDYVEFVSSSFKRSSQVELGDFTSDLQNRLRTLYAQ